MVERTNLPIQIKPGLWRWECAHPDWVAGAAPVSPGDFPELVGSVACATNEGMLLIDPLITGDCHHLWKWLADESARLGGVTSVLTTIQWHDRSGGDAMERFACDDHIPAGVQPIPIEGAGETMFWLEAHGALVPGDRLIGDGTGGLRVCPPSWVEESVPGGLDPGVLEERLAPLLDLPVEMVLVSHGEPVLVDAAKAIAQAIDGASN
ncbi:MAG: hypothetical protein ACKOPI_01155 [bacterium]